MVSAPTRASCRDGFGFACSASRRDRGVGRNSSISTNSRLCALSTSLAGSVGRPFMISCWGFASAFFCSVLVMEDRNGRIAANGFTTDPAGCCASCGKVGIPKLLSTSADGTTILVRPIGEGNTLSAGGPFSPSPLSGGPGPYPPVAPSNWLLVPPPVASADPAGGRATGPPAPPRLGPFPGLPVPTACWYRTLGHHVPLPSGALGLSLGPPAPTTR